MHLNCNPNISYIYFVKIFILYTNTIQSSVMMSNKKNGPLRILEKRRGKRLSIKRGHYSGVMRVDIDLHYPESIWKKKCLDNLSKCLSTAKNENKII